MDKDLPKAWRSDDADAFRALVEAFQTKVLNTCFRFLHNREDAEDTAQDVFLEIARSLADFRGEAELSTWIYRIAVTKSLDALRKRKRKKRFDASSPSSPPAAGLEDIPAPRSEGPDEVLELQERARILQGAIETLAENQRAALTLSRYEGLTNKSIADILGTTVPAVDSLLHRAYKNLRKKLARYYAQAIDREGQI